MRYSSILQLEKHEEEIANIKKKVADLWTATQHLSAHLKANKADVQTHRKILIELYRRIPPTKQQALPT